jgi:hypothetical protein
MSPGIDTEDPAFPGFAHFYLFQDPWWNRRRMAVDFADPTVRDLLNQLIWASAPTPTEPITMRWVWGDRTPSDIVWADSDLPPFVSPKVINVLQDHGLTGWDRVPAHVIDRNGDVHTDYSFLVITGGRCSALDWSRGELINRTEDPPWGWVYRGAQFNPASWDGSDLFRSAGWKYILATERVKTAFERARIPNVVWAALSDQERDEREVRLKAGLPLPRWYYAMDRASVLLAGQKGWHVVQARSEAQQRLMAERADPYWRELVDPSAEAAPRDGSGGR